MGAGRGYSGLKKTLRAQKGKRAVVGLLYGIEGGGQRQGGGGTHPLSRGGAETLEAGADDLDTGAPGNPPTFPKEDDQRE